MKKLSISLLLFFLTVVVFPKSALKIGPYAGYFAPRDELTKEIYGDGGVTYGAKIGVRVFNGLGIWLTGSQFSADGETPLLGDKTSLTLMPLTLSLRYTLPKGKIRPYAGVGYCYLFYEEKSDIGDNTKKEGKGYSLDAGLEIKLGSRIHADICLNYNDVKVPGPLNSDIQLGGLQLGLSFLILI
ncbi:MAG: porin family protein [bacterium]|nr:porin family protein [bacterium]